MTVVLFANSKAALAFAGCVLFGTALLTSALGNQFIPKTGSGEVETDAYTSDSAADEGYTMSDGGPINAQGEVQITADGSSETEVPVGFASDEELIADTSGFNPSPMSAKPSAQQAASKAAEPVISQEEGSAPTAPY